MICVHDNYDELFNLDNIFTAWRKFRRGKASKKDVMNFELHLEDNLFALHEDLQKFNYKHSTYKHFQIFDNKKRDIYKAKIRDKIVHQIIYDYLLCFFESEFISDSYSSRLSKGQYKAISAFRYFVKLANGSNKICFILKCDIKKYFDSIDQKILIDLIKRKVFCPKILKIIREIICSYTFSKTEKRIPLGNITSQIFANIYLSDLDIYIKNKLRCNFYIRYNDDFVIISESMKKLEEIREKVIMFVRKKLLLEIPIEKTSIRKLKWGVDFLGFTILPNAVLLRNKTKDKLYKNISIKNIHSYFAILKHCKSYNLKRKILSMEKLFKS
jgi:RNA-directed DNA polymerase